MAKLRKKLSKSRNSPNYGAKKNELSFLISHDKTTFNRLRLAFIKALILQYFHLEYYIWIETDTSGYAIGDILSQFAFETRPDKIVTKTNLS